MKEGKDSWILLNKTTWQKQIHSSQRQQADTGPRKLQRCDTKTQIDFILSSDGKIVGNCEVITKVDIGCDRRIVRARVEIKKNINETKKIQKPKPFNLDLRVLEKLAAPFRTELIHRFD